MPLREAKTREKRPMVRNRDMRSRYSLIRSARMYLSFYFFSTALFITTNFRDTRRSSARDTGRKEGK